MLVAPGHAAALIDDAHTIDGPSGAVLDLGGVAMSEDGSGGLVYRKIEGGRAHVFVAQFTDGSWRPPQRVDVGQSFDSSWPRIAAADRGRLVVTWVQEFGPDSDRMYSATLDPGARRFQGPVPVDINVGEATATYPSLAMNRGGAAYLTYRVVRQGSNLPPGYVDSDIRIARYRAPLWTVFGSLVDRNPVQPMATPTEGNSPKVGVGLTGDAIVGWQEPGDDFVDRIWARRVFGTTLGIPLLVSPDNFGGAPLRGGADSFSVDVAGFSTGAVALRQLPGEGSRLPGPRVFVNSIPDATSENASRFGTPRMLDAPGGLPGSTGIGISPLSTLKVAYGLGNATVVADGDSEGIGKPERVDDGRSSAPGDPVVEYAENGAAVTAWKVRIGNLGAANVQELRADGVPELRTVSGPAGGFVNQLESAGSGLGDAMVGFEQGGGNLKQIAASVVDAPPAKFLVLAPHGFTRKKRVRINWDEVDVAISPVTYSLAVDDETVVESTHRTTRVLGPRQLPNGVHRVDVIAIDRAGQETVSSARRVKVDRRAPRVRLRRRGRSLSVSVSDGRRSQVSGLRRGSVRISFGDRTRRSRRARSRHLYARGGVFKVRVTARDRAGNRTRFARRVRIG